MASLGHVAIGMAAARFLDGRSGATTPLPRAMLAWAALALLPDADVIGFAFGVRYADAWGHRGATHSLVFALACALLAFGLARLRGWRAALVAFTTFVVVASHPLLDMLTTGGLGVALYWPFSLERHFLPWRPIPVAPIGLGFLSRRGLYCAVVELALFLPFWAWALVGLRDATRRSST